MIGLWEMIIFIASFCVLRLNTMIKGTANENDTGSRSNQRVASSLD